MVRRPRGLVGLAAPAPYPTPPPTPAPSRRSDASSKDQSDFQQHSVGLGAGPEGLLGYAESQLRQVSELASKVAGSMRARARASTSKQTACAPPPPLFL